MYSNYFDFKLLPFENVPDPKFFFDEGNHARVHTRIKESLKAGRGLMVVTGPIGSGKTTLSRMLISEFTNDVKFIWMAEPPSSAHELFLYIAGELGLNPSSTEKAFVLRDLRDAFLKMSTEGNRCMIIIDEAHLINDDTIQGIRLLNNLEEGAIKLVHILLLGQEEILDVINRPDMEAFKQRIANLEVLGKMNDDRIRDYVHYRIKVAGGNTDIFSETGMKALTLAFNSGGTPRLINSLCDRTLDIAAERHKKSADAHDVYEAAKGMGLSSEIFHYIVSLKAQERKDHLQHLNNSTVMESQESSNGDKNTLINPHLIHNLTLQNGLGYRESRDNLRKPIFYIFFSLIIIAAIFLLIFRFGP